MATDAQRALVLRRALAGASLNGLGAVVAVRRLRRRAPRRCLGARVRPRRPRRGRRRPRAALRRLPRGARPARALGSRPAAARGGRPGGERARGMGRPPGARLRLRGSDRRAVGSAQGARRPRRRPRLASLRAGPAGLRLASADGGRPRRRSPTGAWRNCRPRTRRSRTPRWPISSGRSSPTARAPSRRRSRAPCASSRARAPAERSSSWPTRCSACCGRGSPAESIGLVCPSLDRLRAPLETALAGAGVPYAIEGRGAARPDALRPRAPLRAPLPLAEREPARPLRLPALAATPGCRAPPPTTSRGACAGTGFAPTSRTRSSRCAASLCRRSPTCALPRRRPSPCACSHAAQLRAAHGVESPPVDEASLLDLRCLGGAAAASGRARRLEGADRRALARRGSRRARAPHGPLRLGGGARQGRGPRPPARAHAPLRHGLRPRPGGGEVPAPRRPVAFLDDDTRRSLDERTRARLVRPEPVSRERYLFYAACTRPSRRLYLVREAATDDGAPRLRRARSGTRRGRSSTRPTWRGGRAGGRSRR